MNKANVDIFDKLFGQLVSTYEEISLLSKKNPNDAVNEFKLRFINKLVHQSNDFLEEYKPFEDFDSFNEDSIPQNSDVVFILSQYLQCFERLRADNVVQKSCLWYWSIEWNKNDKLCESDKVEDGIILIRTTKPKKLKE